MNKIKSQLVLGILVILLAVSGTTGCVLFAAGAAAGAGAAGYKYAKGELRSVESASLDRTWDASLGAAQDLGLPVLSQTRDAMQGHLVCKASNDKKVDVNLKSLSNTNTEVRIRVGTFGDESMSLTILNAIHKRLNSGIAQS